MGTDGMVLASQDGGRETAGHMGAGEEQIRKKNGETYKKHSAIRKRLLIHDKAG